MNEGHAARPEDAVFSRIDVVAVRVDDQRHNQLARLPPEMLKDDAPQPQPLPDARIVDVNLQGRVAARDK